MTIQEVHLPPPKATKKFRVFSRIVNNKTIQEIICDGNTGFCKWVTSNLSEAGDVKAFVDEAITSATKLKILNARSAKIQPRFKFLAIGQPDFLPIAFLEKGLRASAPVCRICRRYNLDDLMALLAPQNVDDFPEILHPISIHLQLDPDFWQRYAGQTLALACRDRHFQHQQAQQREASVIVPFATGFLVGRHHLLTNFHVFPDLAVVRDCIAQFNYERDAKNRSQNPVNYAFDADFWVGNERLDYSLVKLASLSSQAELDQYKVDYYAPGDNFGWLPMTANPAMVSPPLACDDTLLADIVDEKLRLRLAQAGFAGEPVSLIHHPRGRHKEITLFDNRVQAIYENTLEYMTDSDLGSSGCPVLNRDWELVALHHALVVEDCGADPAEPATPHAAQPPQTKMLARVKGSAGIRIHRIVQDLETFQVKREPSLNAFLQEYVHNQITRPSKIFLSFIENLEQPTTSAQDVHICAVLKQLIERVKTKLQANHYQVWVAQSETLDPLALIDWINDSSYPQSNVETDYRVGDVALQFSLMHNSEHPELRGVSAYYIGYKAERRSHADIVLQALTKALPELPNRGSRADDSQSVNGLPFCQDVMMPSLILNLGFWTNAADRRLLQAVDEKSGSQLFEQLTDGLANGIITWSQSLNPMAAVLAASAATAPLVYRL
ncbi:MAG: trypsin-like peptidase domain-containing protein [Almyronema sp.]